MSQPVNLSNEVYDKLKFFRDKRKFKSFSAAIDELIRSYWSPVMSEVQIQEEFSKLKMFLGARDLLDAKTEEAINYAQARAFQHKEKKKLHEK